MGVFLLIRGALGGLIGTDPFYEVLHAHYAFNTDLNPNGVPLFMLPMTVGVFSLYTVVLYIALVIFVFVEGALGYTLWKYRARKGAVAAQIHGNTRLEIGWTVGAGFEYMFAGNWSVKGEYLYVDLGTLNGVGVLTPPFAGFAYTNSTRVTANIARVGVNYHFGGPVVARY